MKIAQSNRSSGHERGSALAMALLSVTVLAGFSAALLTVNVVGSREQTGEEARTQARYVSQAGLSEAMLRLKRGEDPNVGSAEAPMAFGGARFWVEADVPSGNLTRMRATGFDGRAGARMELVVREVPNTIWRYGAFGREFLHMDSNARVDSYDSSLGTYASQAVNGSGSSAYALGNGHVGSNGAVHLDQNAKVWGDAIAGPNHTTTVLGNAVVTGSTAPASAPMDLPSISVPTYTAYGSVSFNANTTIPSSNRTYANVVVGNNRTLTVNGPASLVMSNLTLRSGSRVVIDPTNGPVEIYVIDSFVMNSNSQMYPTSYRPEHFSLKLLSDNVINPEVNVQLDTVDFDSNSSIHGTIYAPDAAITFDSNFELFGAIIARSIDIDSNSRFHFDEALTDALAMGDPTFETVCWRDIPLTD
ncbi:MAG: hypothetical protein JNK02_10675 [Planctomycetes bacterium]|nr:hypothetical protein [Planctomycetota bacterium]